jgi:hypothetical protein
MVIYVDIETTPMSHGSVLPTFCIAGYAFEGGPVEFTEDANKVRSLLKGGDGIKVICHRGAFEFGVLGIGDAFNCASRFDDTAIRGTIIGASMGDHDAAGHSLEDLAVKAGLPRWKKVKGKAHKELTLSFRPGGPYSELQLDYLRHDVQATRAVYLSQGGSKVAIPDVERQTRWSRHVFSLSRAGISIDSERLRNLITEAEANRQRFWQGLRDCGLIEDRGPKKDPTRDQVVSQQKVQEMLRAAGAVRLADKGRGVLLAADSEALKATCQPPLVLLAEYKEVEKWLALLHGYEDPSGFIRTRYNSLVTTGRMSSSEPNVQQVPGHGGLRECWIPRAGNAFVEADYKALELYTFADTCAHWGIPSSIGDALNAGEDVHQVVATRAGLGRKLAKVLNFGGLGGIGPVTMAAYAKKQGEHCPPEALKAWRKAIVEFPEYKKRATSQPHKDNTSNFNLANKYYVTSPQSGRRRLSSFTSSLNFGFQSPGSDVIKRSIELCMQAGVPIIAALHDQLLADVPLRDVQEVSVLMPRLMQQAGQEICTNMRWPLPEVHVFNERWHSKE